MAAGQLRPAERPAHPPKFEPGVISVNLMVDEILRAAAKMGSGLHYGPRNADEVRFLVARLIMEGGRTPRFPIADTTTARRRIETMIIAAGIPDEVATEAYDEQIHD